MFQIQAHIEIQSKIEFREIITDKFFLEKIDLLIIDKKVDELYFSDINFPCKLVLQSSEMIKEFDYVIKIIEFFNQNLIQRSSKVYCIGGGTICDLVGFAASIYKRGIELELIPTTLLSMADASIGGKNGINYKTIKNLIGNFYLPKNVYIDTQFLNTLEEMHFLSGLVEIIKIALISSPPFWDFISSNRKEILSRDNNIINLLINQAVKLKSDIVNQDPLDKNLRMILNFGHTFGHSIELLEEMPHGFAVAKGINIALLFSEKYLNLNSDVRMKISNLFSFFGIDDRFTIDDNKFLENIKYDKKNSDCDLNLILLQDIGKPINYQLKYDEFEYTFKNLFKS